MIIKEMAGPANSIQLTPSQKEAVSYLKGPLLIIAGPGSGKTEVISSRAAHLISSGAAQPKNILVTTFTEKAALELKDRIQRKLPHTNVELMQVSTIHSFCYTLLRQFQSASPFPRGFWVLDEAAQLLFIYSRRKELGLSQVMKGRESDFYSSVLQTFNHATEELVDPDQYIAACQDSLKKASDEDQADWEEKLQVARAYKKYLRLLLDSNATDFSNLQRHTLDMLNHHPEILRQIQDRYTEVLIDEYQDTNMVQELILGKIAEPHMHYTVVGDDDQSIYRFRGATVKNILGFCKKYQKKCPALKTVKLEDNFRSLEPIINHSGRLIRFNQKRAPKNLCCHRRDYKNDILYIHQRTAAQEAQAVVSVLNKLLHDGTIKRYGDIALLLRSVRSYAQPYLEALTQKKIPHIVTRDGYFFKRDDISEIYHLFLFLATSKAWGDKFVRCSIFSFKKETEAALKKYKKDLTALDSPEKLKNIGVTDPQDREKLAQLIHL
ncbi:ATP-dependent helicase, partial [bacterium]|nr:ATP-dependent helicase [bacterium]